nr:IS1634 family transposase [Deltaproteobacteria bacterium]
MTTASAAPSTRSATRCATRRRPSPRGLILAFALRTIDAHYDTTSLWLRRAYDDSELAARGHSKDGRGDHKQVVVGTVTTEDGEVPLAHAVHRGNTGDVSTVPEALRSLRACVPHDPVVISGDSVMGSRANMDAVAAAEGIFLGPIAMGPKVVEWVCAAEPTIEVAVSLLRQKEPVRYLACVASRFAVNGVADAGTHLVIFDPRRAQQEATERTRALARLETGLDARAASLNQGRLKTLDAAKKKLRALLTRHGLAARYLNAELVTEGDSMSLRRTRDEAALAAAPGRDGRWPLVTNRSGLSDEELCTWAVRRYKTHGRIERDHHLLKGPLAVRPLFVQNDARIRSLVAVCVWALTAWKLMERRAPGALASMRSQANPKASLVEQIEAFFQAIALVRFRVSNNVRQASVRCRRARRACSIRSVAPWGAGDPRRRHPRAAQV